MLIKNKQQLNPNCIPCLALNMVIKANHQVLDFLDVTLDLTSGEYRPYNKPNNTPLYVHKESNHPPTVLNQIPKIVERRLSDLSSSREVFEREKGPYIRALNQSGYSDIDLQFKPGPPSLQREKET